MRPFKWIVAALALALAGPTLAPKAAAEPVPIAAFTDHPQFARAALSPSGRYIAGVRREGANFVLVVLDWQTKQVTPIQRASDASEMRFDFVNWKSDDQLIFGVSQLVTIRSVSASARRNLGNAEEDKVRIGRIYASSRTGQLVTLFSQEATTVADRTASTALVSRLPDDPNHVLISAGTTRGLGLFKANITTGAIEQVEMFTVDAISSISGQLVVDRAGRPILRQTASDGGRGVRWLRRDPQSWREVARFAGAAGVNSSPDFDVFRAAGAEGMAYVAARRNGADTAAMYLYDTRTGEFKDEVSRMEGFDYWSLIGAQIILHPRTDQLIAVCGWTERLVCDYKDRDFARHMNAIKTSLGDQVTVQFGGMSDDGQVWVVTASGPQDLGSTYRYDTTTRSLDFVGGVRPDVDPAELATAEVVRFQTRDGVATWGYLWTPPGAPRGQPLPAVVIPHGGPEVRDFFGFDDFATYYANRGYAVFQPHYRGSGGTGRRWVEAGWRQYGQRMQDDVIDGTRAMVAAGRIDADRLCIMGWSYGGYAAMAATFLNKDTFKCAVAGAGISDLEYDLRQTRADEGGLTGMSYQYWSTAKGRIPEDLDMMRRYSAYHRVQDATMPLLLIHPTIDDVVPVEQSRRMKEALERIGRPIRLIELPGENHSPERPESMRLLLDESEKFIRQHLGPGVGTGAIRN